VKWLMTLVFLLVAVDARAFSTVVNFTDANRQDLRVLFLDSTQLTEAANECDVSAAQPCTEMYWIERRVKGGKRIEVDRADVDISSPLHRIAFRLHEPVNDPSDLVLIASAVSVVDPATGGPKSAGWREFPIVAQLEQLGDAERPTLQYQSLLPTTLDNTPMRRGTLSSNLTVTDPDNPTKKFDVYVRRVRTPGGGPDVLHDIEVAGLPRGKKVKASLKGVETFNGLPVAAKATLQAPAFPKGRDDASFFLNASAEADDIASEQKYKLDTRIHPTWRTESWEIGPKFEATLGNTTSKAPNTAALSADFRYWFAEDIPGFIQSHSIVFAPIYRTDRKFDNRDSGIDVTWEPFLRPFEGKTLERRRALELRSGGVPQAIHWGFRIRPKIALEYGKHIESASAELDDEQYSRLRGEVVAFIEWQQLRFTVAAQTRHLFNEEVILNDKSEVVRISASTRNYVRAELAYDLGIIAVTLTHNKGRTPPAFTPTHSTAFGITWKF